MTNVSYPIRPNYIGQDSGFGYDCKDNRFVWCYSWEKRFANTKRHESENIVSLDAALSHYTWFIEMNNLWHKRDKLGGGRFLLGQELYKLWAEQDSILDDITKLAVDHSDEIVREIKLLIPEMQHIDIVFSDMRG